MKKNNVHVPGSRTLMPTIVTILQENNGELSYCQVVYMVLFKLNLPKKLIKKAFNEVSFSGVYLRKTGFFKESKKGIWILKDEYMNISFDEAKRITYDKYDRLLGRK